MDEHYTDEDVERGKDALGDALWRHLQAVTSSGTELTQAVLDAVAPAIAARALREFTKVFMGETPGLLLDAGTCRSIDLLAQERADEIEGR